VGACRALDQAELVEDFPLVCNHVVPAARIVSGVIADQRVAAFVQSERGGQPLPKSSITVWWVRHGPKCCQVFSRLNRPVLPLPRGCLTRTVTPAISQTGLVIERIGDAGSARGIQL